MPIYEASWFKSRFFSSPPPPPKKKARGQQVVCSAERQSERETKNRKTCSCVSCKQPLNVECKCAFGCFPVSRHLSDLHFQVTLGLFFFFFKHIPLETLRYQALASQFAFLEVTEKYIYTFKCQLKMFFLAVAFHFHVGRGTTPTLSFQMSEEATKSQETKTYSHQLLFGSLQAVL